MEQAISTSRPRRLRTVPATDRNVFYLIGVLLLMWSITTLSLIWWHWADLRYSSIANEYHLASAELAAEVGNQALSVLRLTQPLEHFVAVHQEEVGGAAGAPNHGIQTFKLALDGLLQAADKNLLLLRSTQQRAGDGMVDRR